MEIEELEALEKDDNIQAPKIKKPRTQKQIDAFLKVQQTRDANRASRKIEKEESTQLAKIETEKKIVKKAIALKKKEILKEVILDDMSSDDEVPMEIIKKLQKKYLKKKMEAPVIHIPVIHEIPKITYRFI